MEENINEKLKSNEFYLLVNASGQYLKTRFQEDFDKVKIWQFVLFSDIVSNSKTLFFKIGNSTQKKRINQLKISKPQSSTIWFDVNELDIKAGNRINQVFVGGKGDDYERL